MPAASRTASPVSSLLPASLSAPMLLPMVSPTLSPMLSPTLSPMLSPMLLPTLAALDVLRRAANERFCLCSPPGIQRGMRTCAPASASEGQHRQRGAAGLGWKICDFKPYTRYQRLSDSTTGCRWSNRSSIRIVLGSRYIASSSPVLCGGVVAGCRMLSDIRTSIVQKWQRSNKRNNPTHIMGAPYPVHTKCAQCVFMHARYYPLKCRVVQIRSIRLIRLRIIRRSYVCKKCPHTPGRRRQYGLCTTCDPPARVPPANPSILRHCVLFRV
mmetsp:Transcript_35900/g.106095  ORF Transcript_35900/g.106095 Transcript_35900/m.106095 type:complete len:270 (-) Transcript_35900:344-1153(-)